MLLRRYFPKFTMVHARGVVLPHGLLRKDPRGHAVQLVHPLQRRDDHAHEREEADDDDDGERDESEDRGQAFTLGDRHCHDSPPLLGLGVDPETHRT